MGFGESSLHQLVSNPSAYDGLDLSFSVQAFITTTTTIPPPMTTFALQQLDLMEFLYHYLVSQHGSGQRLIWEKDVQVSLFFIL